MNRSEAAQIVKLKISLLKHYTYTFLLSQSTVTDWLDRNGLSYR